MKNVVINVNYLRNNLNGVTVHFRDEQKSHPFVGEGSSISPWNTAEIYAANSLSFPAV